MLTGWTGKEISFAAEYIKQWDEIESRHDKKTNEINQYPDPCCSPD
jgi:phage regulator Rha-like protein